MKTAMFRLFNVLMAVVVLASSTGFGFIEHSCMMHGRKTYSFTKQENCLADKKNNSSQQLPNQTTLKKAKCCKDEDKYENVSYPSSISQLVAKFVQPAIDYVVTTFVTLCKILLGFIYHSTSASVVFSPHVK